ncbi:cAMP-binding domain of CRP or a regulatory subunit of cAMP-dependent protein kinases [Chitinophaga eiseniae]|uniref:cAMP-binding domain of CRP or a regulatory subunit of cAMP-dependent protein kinases n=1 Tax=Chitinophaga eiseniae TaxID=634771 RepID=A0A1T4T9V6_9BACT|nr:Crp/Fnr family transcriptional regulator [Chitinophaga eiseniae]SKA37242.1 cAMP-binding domain of CRP or a regulatory subunit of cAMP-dependent protein kinases [Chitinophaga eiseniae]
MNEKELQLLKNLLFKAGSDEEHRKGSTIIQEGVTSNRFYYLKKGLLRGWTNNDGKEITFQFLFENHVFCSAESFFYNTPCSYSIEALEDSVLLSVDKAQMDLLQKDTTFLNLFNQYLISRVAAYQQLLISRIQDKPEVRYKKLLQEHPEMLLRIPQHYIASYLGITAVSLSRIRNR